MALPHDDEEEKPLDPAVERVRRKLVRFISINLAILGVALLVVVAALFFKATRPSPPRQDGPVAAEVALPAGARLASQSLSGDRLSLEAELPDGSRLLVVVDVTTGREIARLSIAAR